MSRPCESEFCSVPALLSSVASAKVRWSARCTNLFLVAEALPELVRSESDKSIGRKQATSAHCATSEDRASNDTRTISYPCDWGDQSVRFLGESTSKNRLKRDNSGRNSEQVLEHHICGGQSLLERASVMLRYFTKIAQFCPQNRFQSLIRIVPRLPRIGALWPSLN